MPYKDPEKAKARKALKYQENKEKVAAKHKAYYEANKEKLKEQAKENYLKDRDNQLENKRQWYQENKNDPGFKEAANERMRNWMASHRDAPEVMARKAVRAAIQRGTLIKSPCQVCQEPIAVAHHHLGYERAHWLDVTWLCNKHHNEAHGIQI